MNVIEVEDLSKIYRLGYTGTGSLKDDLAGMWAKMRGKPNPNALAVDTNDRADSKSDGYVYALKDINFNVEQGEVLGIIGKNGAGKSTLLKILTRVTGPTTGSIKMKGRVGSLLEVGTGFNPELSGKENVYLNGAILGMRKAEIDRKYSDIVDFAGVSKYIDTPVKRYSSGMRVRLGFAVAAFLEPEILIIDEVLAVGDAQFQKRAIGKMQEVAKTGKRTVLFVSHNMGAVSELCPSAMLIENGMMHSRGNTEQIISLYHESCISDFESYIDSPYFLIENIQQNKKRLYPNEKFSISLKYTKLQEVDARIAIVIAQSGRAIYQGNNIMDGCDLMSDKSGEITIEFDKIGVLPGNYTVHLGIKDPSGSRSLIKSAIIATVEVLNNLDQLELNDPIGGQFKNWATPVKPYKWLLNGKEVEGSLPNVRRLFWD